MTFAEVARGSLRVLGHASIVVFGLAGVVPLAAAADKDPEVPAGVVIVPHDPSVFRPDPQYEEKPYSADDQLAIYGGKFAVQTPRPIFELGRRQYTTGPFEPGIDVLGETNLFFPSLAVYGDWRTAVAFNDNGAAELGVVATRLNLDVDLKLTASERIHAFFRPVDQGGRFTRYEFAADDDDRFEAETDGNLETLFFEGDLGAIAAGLANEQPTFDLAFAVGLMPLVMQNGVWVEDAFTGLAVSIPARNSVRLDISNFDVTFFIGFDKVSSSGVLDNANVVADHNVNLYGATAFVEATGGYWEAGYAYTDGEKGFDDQSYHNLTIAHTRRLRNWLSNSVRLVWNAGQSRANNVQQNADGAILLIENSLITSKPLTLVPYANLFAGFDRPQSLARAAGAGGILKNTGINFETDGLTGFPKLDDTGRNTWGGAMGVQYLFNLDRQIVVEAAALQVIEGDNEPGRPAAGDQYAIGVRYQHPLDKAWIVRGDAMHGWRDNQDDLLGVRLELRRKF